jgi:hypothetical protein
MSTFGVARFPQAVSISFAGREVRLPSHRSVLLAWGSGHCLDLFFFRPLLLPIASSFASGHVNLFWVDELSQPPASLP